jgi:hypothetical protein
LPVDGRNVIVAAVARRSTMGACKIRRGLRHVRVVIRPRTARVAPWGWSSEMVPAILIGRNVCVRFGADPPQPMAGRSMGINSFGAQGTDIRRERALYRACRAPARRGAVPGADSFTIQLSIGLPLGRAVGELGRIPGPGTPSCCSRRIWRSRRPMRCSWF